MENIVSKKCDYVKSPGIYIHIPFCVSKCRYCDFYSEKYSKEKMDLFIECLKKEITFYAKILPSLKIKTIYFGGGTPSLLAPYHVQEILDYIYEKFSPPISGEITLEANPDSLTEERIAAYNTAGISRLSLGVQSLRDEELQFLGRLHDSDKAEEGIKKVKKYFDNYNIDLIYGLPGQRLEEFLYSLEWILDYSPPHISIYNLQIESGTPLGEMLQKGALNRLSEGIEAKMFSRSINVLQKAGYKHYEISNFALPGYNSIHNQIYWKYQSYLGWGPSAHSFSGSSRFYNYNDFDKYCHLLTQAQLPVAEKRELSRADLISETMIMGLRLLTGISKKEFFERFSVKLRDIYSEQIDKLTAQGLLQVEKNKIFLTRKGIFLGNYVFQEFLLDNNDL
ncbi:MAG: radical SAM family heme chaperone HemW [Halanaerobiaceae bacterium]